MNTYLFLFFLILVSIILLLSGILIIKFVIEMYHKTFNSKTDFKKEAKKRYERKYVTKRIPISSKSKK